MIGCHLLFWKEKQAEDACTRLEIWFKQNITHSLKTSMEALSTENWSCLHVTELCPAIIGQNATGCLYRRSKTRSLHGLLSERQCLQHPTVLCHHTAITTTLVKLQNKE